MLKNQNKYVPSKFNAQSNTEDNGIMLFNSYSGAIAHFSEKEKADVLASLKRIGINELDTDVKQALFDNGFLVPQHIDELKRAQFLHQSMHRTDMMHLVLMTTEACNFRCTYCYEHFLRGKMTPETIRGLKALVREKATNLSNLHISWFGGEPLIELGVIEELSASFRTTAAENQINYSADIVTNGYFLTKDVFQKLVSWDIRQFMITIDGIEAVHNQRRPLAGGGGTFKKIIENLKVVKESTDQFDLTIRVNFDESNLQETKQLIQLLKAHFADDPRFGLFFRPVGKWGGKHDDDIPTCTHITANKKIWEFTDEALTEGLSMSSIVAGAMMPTASVCYAAKPYALVVGSDGQIYKCTTCLDEEMNKVGHIYEDGILDLDYDKIAHWVTSGEETDSVCQSCFYRPTCQGNHCPYYRMVTGERPCPSEKRNIRKVLNLIWKNSVLAN